jgi:hypothetical protein
MVRIIIFPDSSNSIEKHNYLMRPLVLCIASAMSGTFLPQLSDLLPGFETAITRS